MLPMVLALTVVAQVDSPKWVNEPTSLAPGVTHSTIRSKSNGVDIGYSLYLPPSYERTKKRYPLLVFLHGAGGNESGDAGPGGFTTTFESVVAAGAFPEAAILFPNGLMSSYRDQPEKKQFIQTYILKELIPSVERHCRVGGKREKRLLVGFSMGAGGASRLMIENPSMFAAVIGWGSSVNSRNKGTLEAFVAAVPTLRAKGARFYYGAGEKDPFAQAPEFHAALAASGLKSQVRELPGIGHDLGAYYRLTAEEAFRFVAPAIK